MTTTAAPPTPLECVAAVFDSPHDVAQRARDAIQAAAQALTAFDSWGIAPPWSDEADGWSALGGSPSVGAAVGVPTADLAAVCGELFQLRALTEGAAVAVALEAVTRGVVAESISVDVDGWVRDQAWDAGVGLPPSVAAGVKVVVEQARRSRPVDLRPLAAAVVAGRVPITSATNLGRELDLLAKRVPEPVWETAAAELIDWAAQGASPSDLRTARQRIAALYGTEAFEEEQATAKRHRDVTSWKADDAGGWTCRVHTDNEGRSILDAAFDALAGPSPEAADVIASRPPFRPAAPCGGADQPDADASAKTDAKTDTLPDSDTVTPTRDTRTAGQRRHDALIELARVIATDPSAMTDARPTSAVKAQVTITLDFERLRAGLGPGIDGHGTPLTAATVRRMCCDAALIPAVLGSDSAILDWGRARRLASADQVRYLRQRDKGCTFPGCSRPPAWTEAHHLDEWLEDSGTTNVDRLALLCCRHHDIVHAHRLKGELAGGRIIWKRRDA
ncbi:MAG: HNH endonuclease [Actinobacteria bacterium]|nr:HNH endonuclease [Actinomycetota bacterium]